MIRAFFMSKKEYFIENIECYNNNIYERIKDCGGDFMLSYMVKRILNAMLILWVTMTITFF